MLVLTVNPGSAGLRAHLVDTTDDRVVDSAETAHPAGSEAAHEELGALIDRIPTVGVSAVGVRVVHGGEHIVAPVVLTDDRLDQLRQATSLAPVHLPGTLAVLDFLRERFPARPLVLCPDTAFHADLPAAASTYAVPERWRSDWGLRRYGFHGLSFAWAATRAAELLDRPLAELDLLIAHLSDGCSVCAVRGGRSVDTSMGMTPVEGLAMSRRSGSVDPGMLLWLLREKKLSLDELEDGLNRESGLLGLSGGKSGDTRELVPAADEGDEDASLALTVFTHRARRELAGVATGLERVDALVFTGDIGWGQPEVAERIASELGVLGIGGGLRTERDEDAVISPPEAKIPVLAIRSREELQLAREAARAAQP